MSWVRKFLVAGMLIPGAAAIAQNAPPKVDPVADATGPIDPRVSYLKRTEALTDAEARSQVASEEAFQAEAKTIMSAFPGSFIASEIQRKPNFKIFLYFDRDVGMAELNALVSPTLRSVIAVRRSKLSATEIEAAQRDIIESLSPVLGSIQVNYTYQNGKFRVVVDEGLASSAIVAAIPTRLRSDVQIERGVVALDNAEAPTGYGPANDIVWGGFPLFTSTGAGACTANFVLEYTSNKAPALGTAAHCTPSVFLKFERTNGELRQLSAPDPRAWTGQSNSNRGYDYQIHPLGSMNPAGYLWFDANVSGSLPFCYGMECGGSRAFANVMPDLPNTGYMGIVGVIAGGSAGSANPTHPVNEVRCKYGNRTGVTCGRISASSAAMSIKLDSGQRISYYGFVEVMSQDYMVLSYGGDSGGAVFTMPRYGSSGYYETNAAGINIGSAKAPGDDRSACFTSYNSGCNFIYMPIDRINDHQGIAVRTMTGSIGSF